jgi:UDP-N-acetylmuramate dehydrogenase
VENIKVLSFYPEIVSLAGSSQVLTDVSMKAYSSMKVGGKADVLIEINHLDSLALLLRFLSEREIPTFVMGNGSNLIVSDEGYHGVILRIAKGLSEISVSDDVLESAA